MPNTIAIRHLHFEDLGLLAPLLGRRGHTIRYLEACAEQDLQPADDADLVVILGSRTR